MNEPSEEVLAKEIALTEKKLQKLNEECGQLRQMKQTLEYKIGELTKSTREGTTNLEKWKMEIKV